jgi:hypothetical protein
MKILRPVVARALVPAAPALVPVLGAVPPPLPAGGFSTLSVCVRLAGYWLLRGGAQILEDLLFALLDFE